MRCFVNEKSRRVVLDDILLIFSPGSPASAWRFKRQGRRFPRRGTMRIEALSFLIAEFVEEIDAFINEVSVIDLVR